MVCPITVAESYVCETAKSMKAGGLALGREIVVENSLIHSLIDRRGAFQGETVESGREEKFENRLLGPTNLSWNQSITSKRSVISAPRSAVLRSTSPTSF